MKPALQLSALFVCCCTAAACQPGLAGGLGALPNEANATTETSLVVTPSSEPVPGVRYQRHVVDFGRGVRVFHSISANLGDPRLAVKVTRPDEFFQTTSSFARNSGAAVAINGDFYDIGASNQPHGLTVGDGERWPGTEDDADWRVFACTFDKQCRIEPNGSVTPYSPDLQQVIGGHFIPTLTDGEVMSWDETDDCGAYCTGDHPRTALGLSADGRTLFLLVGEGRITGTHGPSPREVGLMLAALGARNGMMLDGGGSSTLAVSGQRANRLPGNVDTERVVANHLALMFDPAGGFGVPYATATGAGPSGVLSLLSSFGRFTPHTSPQRVLDTRGGVRFGAQESRRLSLSSALPSDALSVLANVTTTDSSGDGYLTAFPGGGRPNTSNLNFGAGRAVAGAVNVGLSSDRGLELFTSNATDVLLDVVGHFGPSGLGFEASSPTRAVDTRATSKLSAEVERRFTLPVTADVSAVSLNVTVTEPEGDGWLAVYPCDVGWTGTSTVNFVSGESRANAAMVRVTGSSVCARSNVATHLVLDLDGVYRAGAGHRFAPVQPTRLLDTRSGEGEWRFAVRAGQVVVLELGRLVGLPAAASAVSVNVIAVEPSRDGFLQVRPCDSNELTSSLNFRAGQTVANLVTARLDGARRVCVSATADTHVVVDAFGVFAP